jgi:hypothetical protein
MQHIQGVRNLLIKGQCHEIFDIRFFCMNQLSPKPLSIQLGPFFRIFRKFAEIFNDTGGQWKKSSIRKIKYLVCHLWLVELT